MQSEITLPEWLDDLIYKELKAHYCPARSDMTNIDDDREKALNYLGTYFPRSFAESYCIFSNYLKNSITFSRKTELSVFDFGSGTGGEIIGLLKALSAFRPSLKKVNIIALDGNQYALSIYERVLDEFRKMTDLQIESRLAPICIDDFYDLHILDTVLNKKFDIIVTFKAICEFVTKDQFERQNAYEHISKFLLPKLRENGIMLLEDVTTYNRISQEWLPKMMDKGLKAANCNVVLQNEGYNQTYTITHSRKSKDISNVAWRLIVNAPNLHPGLD